MKPTLNEQLARMQKLAGIIKENQVSEATGIDAVDYTVKILNKFKRSIPFDAPTILKKAESLKNYIESQYDTEEIGAEMAYTEVDDMIDALNNGDDIMTTIDNAIANLNLSENKESYYKDAEKDDAAHIDALEKDMKDDAKKTSEAKMTKSDLKAKIKEMILAELTEDDDVDINNPGDLNNMYDPLAEAEADSYKELNKKLADLARKGMEDSYSKDDEEELEDHNYDAEFLFKYFKNKSDLFMDEMREYDAEELMNSYPGLSQEEAEKLEDMLQNPLAEAKKDEEVEDVTVDDTEVVDAPASDMMAGESAEISGIQSNLQSAYAEAKALGDEKLITQIANTITYFTKAHILDTAPVNESQINEVLQNDDLIYDRMSDMDQEQLVSMILSFAESNPSVTLVDYLNNEFGYDDESDNDDNYDDNMDVYDDSYPDMAEAKKAKNKLDQINENMFPMLKRILR